MSESAEAGAKPARRASPWVAGSSPTAVAVSAERSCALHLIAFKVAAMERNEAALLVAVKGLRDVARSMDAYRRGLVRTWAMERKAKSKQGAQSE